MTDMSPESGIPPIARYVDLKDRVIFITGGASGIGADLVPAFLAQDAIVVFVDIDVDAGKAIATSHRGRVHFKHCDVTDNEALALAIDEAEQLGGLDILINNAANDQRMTLESVGPDEWAWSVDVNLRHQFFAAQRAAGYMATRGRGSIINFGSVAPEIMVPDLALYSMCKSGVRGLTRSLARDLGSKGIRVNTIIPGAVLTPKQRTLWYPDQEAIDAIVSKQCLKRELEGSDIAHMALFLASDVSAACTAQDFIVDGGIL